MSSRRLATRHPLETTVSYTGMIRASGQEPGEAVISKEVRPPTDDERELLVLDDGEMVIDVLARLLEIKRGTPCSTSIRWITTPTASQSCFLGRGT